MLSTPHVAFQVPPVCPPSPPSPSHTPTRLQPVTTAGRRASCGEDWTQKQNWTDAGADIWLVKGLWSPLKMWILNIKHSGRNFKLTSANGQSGRCQALHYIYIWLMTEGRLNPYVLFLTCVQMHKVEEESVWYIQCQPLATHNKIHVSEQNIVLRGTLLGPHEPRPVTFSSVKSRQLTVGTAASVLEATIHS